MSLRETILPALRWVIGDGRMCAVMGEPWSDSAMQVRSSSVVQRGFKVRDLVDEETAMWNCSKIISLLGHVGCLEIISSYKPPTDEEGPDRLICMSLDLKW